MEHKTQISIHCILAEFAPLGSDKRFLPAEEVKEVPKITSCGQRCAPACLQNTQWTPSSCTTEPPKTPLTPLFPPPQSPTQIPHHSLAPCLNHIILSPPRDQVSLPVADPACALHLAVTPQNSCPEQKMWQILSHLKGIWVLWGSAA